MQSAIVQHEFIVLLACTLKVTMQPAFVQFEFTALVFYNDNIQGMGVYVLQE